MTSVKVKIAPQEAEMDRERVLDLLGKPFEGRYVPGAAEWLKNSLDHAIRTEEPGEPVILLHITTPRGPGRKKDWMMR